MSAPVQPSPPNSVRASSVRPDGAAIMIDGVRHPLRLTLGALALLEEALGADGIEGLRARLSEPRAGDLVLVLHALLMGGGSAIGLDALRASDVDLAAAAKAIAAAFRSLAEPEPSAMPEKPRAGSGRGRFPGATGSAPR